MKKPVEERGIEEITCYEDAVKAFENISRFSIKNPVEDTARCLKELGNPDQCAGLLIHVAGTNGKGSVTKYLSCIFQEMGLRTGCFTSPHLVRMNERIAVDGQPISDEEFYSACRTVWEMRKRLEFVPSYFESLFLMAMLHFANRKTDVAVLETGIGGRLDATNAVRQPAVTVITSIGFDHMSLLGNTISEIAAEKAGIMKAGAPCVFDASNPEAAGVIRERAEALGREFPDKKVRLYPLQADDYSIRSMESGVIDFSTRFRYDRNADYRIRSFAPYQAENAALAVLAVKALRDEGLLSPSATRVKRGLYNMFWPARMEEIRPRVFLDGAHNIDGIRRFLEAVNAVADGSKAQLLFSVVNDKDYGDMIRELAHGYRWERILVTEIFGSRRTDSGVLRKLFAGEGALAVTSFPNFKEAYSDALQNQRDGTYIFICGSLYLAGEIEGIIK